MERQERQIERQERQGRDYMEVHKRQLEQLSQCVSQMGSKGLKDHGGTVGREKQGKGGYSQVFLDKSSNKDPPESFLSEELSASQVQWNGRNEVGTMVATLSGILSMNRKIWTMK